MKRWQLPEHEASTKGEAVDDILYFNRGLFFFYIMTICTYIIFFI